MDRQRILLVEDHEETRSDSERMREVSDLKPQAILQKPLDSKGLRTICEGRRAEEGAGMRFA
jgi:hypothetical protein